MERNNRFTDILRHRFLTILTFAAILWLTLAPHPLGEEEIPIPLFPGADKVVHAAMFGGLTLVYLWEYRRHRRREPSRRRIWTAALVSTLLGALIEVAQHVMAIGRGFDLLDIAADAGGAILAAILWILLSSRIKI